MTGAVDWYVGRLLGNPKTCAGAQLRLIGSVTFISAFLNNTPIVAVMIPIVMRWARTIGVAHSQLLIPLSYGAIIGGTCTLIGTSTNLVISGMLEDDYDIKITLFDITPYGVPAAIMGIAYMMIFGPILLPGGRGGTGGSPLDGDEILLGARVTSWSPAAGRSVKRSGLRDTGGLYLVSVRRAATGNIHRAVGQEFVLNVNDIVYFSGLIEGFGDFCHEHGLEIVTNESADAAMDILSVSTTPTSDDAALSRLIVEDAGDANKSLLSDEEENIRTINLMTGTHSLSFRFPLTI
jgi:di/tricarboxylate transporter